MSFGGPYLALVILAMVAFMGTLAWVTNGGNATPRERKSAVRAHRGRRPAKAN